MKAIGDDYLQLPVVQSSFDHHHKNELDLLHYEDRF